MKSIKELLEQDLDSFIGNEAEIGHVYTFYKQHPISNAIAILGSDTSDVRDWQKAHKIISFIAHLFQDHHQVQSYLEHCKAAYHNMRGKEQEASQRGKDHTDEEIAEEIAEDKSLLYVDYVKSILINSAELLIRWDPDHVAKQVDQLANLMVEKYFER